MHASKRGISQSSVMSVRSQSAHVDKAILMTSTVALGILAIWVIRRKWFEDRSRASTCHGGLGT